ncbi:MAG TPA: hypothetical protein VGC39_02120, partial [Candidatus Methylacidiphilales bacterium]
LRPNPPNQMKQKDQNGTSTSIKHRLVVHIQPKGNLGKSTEAILRGEWMRQYEIPWKGYDLDADNHSFSETFPEEVTLVKPSRERIEVGDVIKILRKVNQIPVTVIDPQAHMNNIILSALALIEFPKFAAEAQARATVFVSPVDEVTELENISKTVEALKDSVDYVIVKNRGRVSATKFFDGSQLEKELQEYKAAYLEIPELLDDTGKYLRGMQVKLERILSPAEIIENSALKIDLVHRTIFKTWVREHFRRLDAIKSYLVPDEFAERIQPQAEAKPEKARRAVGINLENVL